MRAAPIIWFTVKWLVIPVGLGAVGYYVVGPRLGDIPAIKGGAKPKPDVASNRNSDSSTTLTMPKRSGEPQVSIDVSPGTAITERALRHSHDTRGTGKKRHKKRSTTPASPAAPSGPPVSAPPSGGDTGGSTGGAGDPGL